jgi:hypothetical protein
MFDELPDEAAAPLLQVAILRPSSSPPLPSPPAAAAAVSSAAAIAVATSSASKLRQAVMKKRAAMNALNPNVKRRADGERGQIKSGREEETKMGSILVPQRAAARAADDKLRTLQEHKQVEEDDPFDDDENGEVDVWKQREKLAQVVSTATAEENAAWTSAENTFADSVIGVITREVQRRKGDHCVGISSLKATTIRANVHAWATTARLQGQCTGTADTHSHAPHGLCPGSFSPQTFFLHGVVQFAHWKAHKRNNDPCQLIRNRCRADDSNSFVCWLASKGRFLYACCHAMESAQESRIPDSPR